MSGTVVCTSTHPVDLDTGRTLAPGETATDVDTEHPHNRGLIIDGSLVVTEGTTPRVRQEDKLVELAAQPPAEQEAAKPHRSRTHTTSEEQN